RATTNAADGSLPRRTVPLQPYGPSVCPGVCSFRDVLPWGERCFPPWDLPCDERGSNPSNGEEVTNLFCGGGSSGPVRTRTARGAHAAHGDLHGGTAAPPRNPQGRMARGVSVRGRSMVHRRAGAKGRAVISKI